MSDTALLEQGVPETIELLAESIAAQLNLPPGIVQIYNQRRQLAGQEGYFIDVAILGVQPFAVSRKYVDDPSTDDLVEVQTVNQKEMIQVDIFSYDESARLRKLDLLFAMTSTAMQQLAERWAIRIGRIPSNFVDLSKQEGSAILNRFAITFSVLRAYGRQASAPTFTQFSNPPKELLVSP